MDVKLKVGDKVRCVDSRRPDGVTKGRVYPVTGVEGDKDNSCWGGRISHNGFNFTDDDGDVRHGRIPFDGYIKWELVTD